MPARGWCWRGRGGYALADVSYDDQSPIFGVADGPDAAPVVLADWQTTENNGLVNPRSVAAAEPDEVWVWNDAVDDLASVVKRVRLDGTVTAGPVTLPRYATVLGDDGPGGLAVQGPSGFYHAAIDGTTVDPAAAVATGARGLFERRHPRPQLRRSPRVPPRGGRPSLRHGTDGAR